MKAILWCWLLAVASVFALERPNIVFLLSDDQDWTGLSVQTHPEVPGSKHAFIQTPNLEKLASEGMRFSAAYAPSPVCASTRISLQTGMNPARLGWTKAGPVVRGAGYKLAAYLKEVGAGLPTKNANHDPSVTVEAKKGMRGGRRPGGGRKFRER